MSVNGHLSFVDSTWPLLCCSNLKLEVFGKACIKILVFYALQHIGIKHPDPKLFNRAGSCSDDFAAQFIYVHDELKCPKG